MHDYHANESTILICGKVHGCNEQNVGKSFYGLTWAAGNHTPAMDIYSLGVLLFVMLCGRKPFDLRDVHTLVYAQKSIKDAPGLADERCVNI